MVWDQCGEMYGKRWYETMGVDPLGIEEVDNRKTIWLDAVSRTQWPALKAAMLKLRSMPVQPGFPATMPDLPMLMSLCGHAAAAPIAPAKPVVCIATGGEVCEYCVVENREPIPCRSLMQAAGAMYLAYASRVGPISEESTKQCREITGKVMQDFACLLSEEQVTREEMRRTLEHRWMPVTQKATAQDFEMWARRSVPGAFATQAKAESKTLPARLPTEERSNSLVPAGQLIPDGLLNFD